MKVIRIVGATVLGVAAMVGVAVQAQEQKPPEITAKVYGSVTLDGSYDSTRGYDGDRLYYVYPKMDGANDNEFNMTARATRLGLNIAGPDADALKPTGKVELDFYGGGSANSANPRLRLAYVNLGLPAGLAVRAGQDTDTFVTVQPKTPNGSTLNDCGYIGHRRPQFRLVETLPLGEAKLVAMAAASRTIGEDIDGAGQDDGADSGVPSFQYNVYAESKLWTRKAAKLGVSGVYGRESVDTVNSNKTVIDDDAVNYNVWAVQGSVLLPLIDLNDKATRGIALQGAIWRGANLDTYLGGVGQGVNKTLATEIGAKGGWAQVTLDLHERINVNVGYGLDDPDDGDLSKSNRSKNEAIFTSLYLKLNAAVTAAVEYANIKTSYKDADNATDNRIQGSIGYTF